MYYNVVEAACIRDYAVYLKFEDGSEGVVDLDDLVGSGGVFDPLADSKFFRRMHFDKVLKTVVWPNGADICPESLYRRLKGAVH